MCIFTLKFAQYSFQPSLKEQFSQNKKRIFSYLALVLSISPVSFSVIWGSFQSVSLHSSAVEPDVHLELKQPKMSS